MYRWLWVVPPGLEQVAAAELGDLGAYSITSRKQAVPFQIGLAGLYRLYLRARIPFRLWQQLARFPCRTRAELHFGVQRAVD